jgi:C4-dicarboxylate-specific signal transduction histidine kinase
MPNELSVDWRAAQRWGIDEARIPPDAKVFFREPTFWQAYKALTLGVAAVLLLLVGLVATLLLERRRRRTSELVVQGQRSELAHASRLAVAGELTASIAHEINQPLGAILASADAAEMLLQSGADRREDLLRIVARIRRDDQRASEVIRRLRALLAKHEPEQQPIELNAAAQDAATLLEASARRRHVKLDLRSAPAPVWVQGDPVQIQQVLINLMLNAIDAVADLPEPRRVVSVAITTGASHILIAVRDRGLGIAAQDLPKVFDSFFSTKKKGMGLGLSIARTIVEAHGGRLSAANGAVDGAEFQVELPVRASSALPKAVAA